MRIRTMAVGVLVAAAWAASADAGERCSLPDAYQITLEARAAVLGTGRGVVAGAQSDAASPLSAGDAVRQVNGHAIESCKDVERAAAAAYSKGLPLLLAVERESGMEPLLVPIGEPTRVATAAEEAAEAAAVEKTEPESAEEAAVERTEPEAAPVVAPKVAAVPAVPVADDEVPASARALAVAPPREEAEFATDADALGDAVGEPAQEVEAPAVGTDAEKTPRKPQVLPPSAEAADDVRQGAVRAVEILREVQQNASQTVPVGVFERARKSADEAIRAVDFGQGEAAAAVRRTAYGVLEMYDTSSEILAAKLVYMTETRQKMNVRPLREMPFFSDGDVPRWVEKYPFLQEAVLEPPTDRRFLQSSGRFDPDRAVELLWEHARDETTRLEGWTLGK